MSAFFLSLFLFLTSGICAQEIQRVSKSPTIDSIYAQAIQMAYQERFTEALHLFDQVIALDPEVAQIYLDRGIIRTHLGDLKGATADYTHQLTFTPKEADVYFLRGEIYLSQKDYKNAYLDLKRANKLDKGNADAYCHCAEVANALNKTHVAKRKARACTRLTNLSN